jgi:head-tail adaptor
MNPGKLNDRITVKRLTRVADGFGGYNSTLADVTTAWCDFKQKAGEIEMVDGKRQRSIEVELIMRKKTADSISVGDIFVQENQTDKFRINEMFESELKYFVKVKATKVD